MKCKLCLKEAEFQESHVIPLFILNWIKRTSATGYIREIDDPNLRKQDCLKLKMLCSACEILISGFEGSFAKRIFYPLQKRRELKKIDYGPWLKRFIVSLAWRTAVSFRWENLSSAELSLLYDSAEDWRRYLMGKNKDTKSEHHLILLGAFKNGSIQNLPSNFFLHLRRNIDANVFNIDNNLVVYVKLPSLIISSFIKPKKPIGWNNTKIYEKGSIGDPQRIIDGGILKYILIERARFVQETKISKKQEKIIKASVFRNLKRSIESGSFDSHSEYYQAKGVNFNKMILYKACSCGSGKSYLDCCLLKKFKKTAF